MAAQGWSAHTPSPSVSQAGDRIGDVRLLTQRRLRRRSSWVRVSFPHEISHRMPEANQRRPRRGCARTYTPGCLCRTPHTRASRARLRTAEVHWNLRPYVGDTREQRFAREHCPVSTPGVCVRLSALTAEHQGVSSRSSHTVSARPRSGPEQAAFIAARKQLTVANISARRFLSSARSKKMQISHHLKNRATCGARDGKAASDWSPNNHPRRGRRWLANTPRRTRARAG